MPFLLDGQVGVFLITPSSLAMRGGFDEALRFEGRSVSLAKFNLTPRGALSPRAIEALADFQLGQEVFHHF
jgi:hypothetical protein